MNCGIPHPKYSSYKCQQSAGHTGNHHARKKMPNGQYRSRQWAPYLQLFNALTKGMH